VRVELTTPSGTDEPVLSAALSAALCRRLCSAGIPASTSGRAEAVLRARILAVDSSAPLLTRGARTLAARSLQLRLEVALFDRQGRTLWRSGLVDLEAPWALASDDPVRAEAGRQRSLSALAEKAARQVVTLLTIGGQRPRARSHGGSVAPATR
jgi:hypothetical protein